MVHKSVFNWSGGKDSALALYYTQQNKNLQIDLLLTSVNSKYRRVSMHGVREELLEAQSENLGIPLQKIMLPDEPSMDEYNRIMGATMKKLKEQRFSDSIFGDIFLEDLRKYREEKSAKAGFKAHFPIWKRNTTELVHEFIDLGFKTIVVCVNATLLDESFAGRIIDKDFLKALPSGIDPCGENGEFHTFVFDGPIFKNAVSFDVGEKVYREYKAPKSTDDSQLVAKNSNPNSMGFWFCDLLPAKK